MREQIVEDIPVYDPVANDPEVIAAKKMAAEIAGQTGQTVNSSTGLINVDPAAIAKKFPTPAADKKTPAGRVYVASDGQEFTDQAAYATYQASLNNKASASLTSRQDASIAAADKQAQRQSAYDLLYNEFKSYGLESLVAPLKGLITSGASPSEFTIKLRETPEYQKRFAANAQRVAKGLTALDEASYLAKEDAYQNIMRNYGLPDTYWKKNDLGTQEGFTNLLANDVSAVELEDRIATAQQRVLNSNPEVLQSLKQFYPDISNADILAYALDPKNALDNIKRKVTAAEIGGAALAQGLKANGGTAESLAGQGITKAQAQQGYATVAEIAPRGSELAAIYGESPYGQSQAEAEVFNTAGSAEAKKKRQRLVGKEIASFSGASGVGALGRDKANPYGTTQSGYGQY